VILWSLCLVTLVLATWWDIRTQRIPVWLPVVPVVGAAWPGAWLPPRGLWLLLAAVCLVLGACLVLVLARVGVGDVALLLPITLALGAWVVVCLVLSLAGGFVTLTWRRQPGDAFVPSLLAGFLLASGLRWAVGG
jgi:Flp pilus assembly protein protease CpaA